MNMKKIEEIAWRKGWISTQEFQKVAQKLLPSSYGIYLMDLIK